MAGKKGMRRREKVMYDPYNFAAVTEKFRAEQEAERQAANKAKQRASTLKVKKQALNKVKENQRKITTQLSKQIKGGQKQLEKQAKRLDKATVIGPLGGEIKVKTLKKISGGAPGLDRGPRSKMFIGKKFSDGGSMSTNARLEELTKNKPFLGQKAGTTDHKKIVYGGKHYTREEAIKLQKKFKKDSNPQIRDEGINKLERFIKRHDAMVAEKQKKKEERKIQRKKDYGGAKPIGAGVYGKGPLGKNFIGKKMNMGGVMKNRGGTFKGVF